MNGQNLYPYSDDLMIYDEGTNKYYITEQALVQSGIDVRYRLAAGKCSNPDIVLRNFLRRVSFVIYNFIHTYSLYNSRQDNLIAKVPELRPILYNALTSQAQYMWTNGDLTMSTDERKRAMAIDIQAQEALNTAVRSLGNRSILYNGV